MRKNPFTPGLPADPEQFVGRKNEIRIFTQSLEQSFYGNPQNLAIMGERGIGKSSLLRKFEKIAEDKNCLVIRRDVDASVNSLQMLAYCILYALKEEGKRFFSRRKKAKNDVLEFFEKHKVAIEISGFGGSIEKAPPVAIQEEFCKKLAEIAKAVQTEVPAIVIMLDEAEHLQNIEGAWGFIRSVFTRLLENGYHFCIIVSGKLGLFKNIKEIFSPMERFFFPKEIDLLIPQETIEAIEKPMSSEGITVTDEVKKMLVEYTDGHPFIVQVFGFYLFESGKSKIDKKAFEEQLSIILDRLKAQVFKDRFDSASPDERRILEILSNSRKKVFKVADILPFLKKKNVPYTRNLLERLVKKDCLRKVGPGQYALFHRLFGLYVKAESNERDQESDPN